MKRKAIQVKRRAILKGVRNEKISGIVESFNKKALKIKTASGTIIIVPWKLLGGYWKIR